MTAAIAQRAEAYLYDTLARAFKPRDRLSVSQWADRYRMLSSKSSAGAMEWRTSTTPYLREIMDCLSEHSPVQFVDVMKATQMGLTEVGLNWIGYVMDHVRTGKPMGIVLPDDNDIPKFNVQRLAPLLRETPPLRELFHGDRSRDESNRRDVKDYPGGILMLEGAKTPIKSWSWRFVFCDEFDEFGWDVKNQGDPMGMIESRQANFSRRKSLVISTPTVKGASRIEDRFNRGDQRYYHVPCPHCGHYQRLKWDNIRWNAALTRAVYICADEGGCGAEIEEHHKSTMLAQGRWIAANPHADALRRSYHISALYSPIGLGFTWLELAKQWLDAQDDIAKLKSFINNRLGESWEDRRSAALDSKKLMERAEPYKLRTIPPGCLILTAGVDTQGNRLETHIVGHGKGDRTWTIDYVVLPGDPVRDEVWSALTELLNKPIINSFGKEMRIEATAIDSGGHHTDEVYAYVRSRPIRRVMAIKGDNTGKRPILKGPPTPQDFNWRGKRIKKGVDLWMVGVNKAKEKIFNKLISDGLDEQGNATGKPADQRLMHFPEGLDERYYDGILSETWDPKKNRWVPRRGRRNEPLDTYGYALAAGHHPELRVHAMSAGDWELLRRILEPEQANDENHKQENKPKTSIASPSRDNGFGSEEWNL